MAEEGKKQVLERAWVDVGVVVKKENPLGAMFVGVGPVEVRGGVRPSLIGERSGKKTGDWKVIKAGWLTENKELVYYPENES